MTDPSPEAEPNRDSPEPTPPDETDDSAEPKPTPRRWSRRAIAIAAAAIALVVVVAGLLGTRILGVWGPDSEPSAEPTPTPTPNPTDTPSPFDGTLAEEFAEGADGIVLPEVEVVGDFTADQVAEALEQVRDALIAARLDRLMVIDHDTEGLVELMAPDQRAAFQGAFDSATFATFATQVAEDAALTSAVPRVAGEITYKTAVAERDLPVLEVVTRFIWVYAFDSIEGDERDLGESPRPSVSQEPADLGTNLVVVRDELVWQARYDERWLEPSQGLWLSDAAARAWGIDCDLYDEDLLGPGLHGAADLSESAGAVFDPGLSPDLSESC